MKIVLIEFGFPHHIVSGGIGIPKNPVSQPYPKPQPKFPHLNKIQGELVWN